MTASVSTFRAPAKINWCLRVVRRRDDGFHEIESLVSPITLQDDLHFTPQPTGTFTLSCESPDVPADDGNLIIRAARQLAALVNHDVGMSCRLVKRIPIGGGLGGGSSNAATTLIALNKLWKLDLPLQQLSAIAADLGSDVPLFLAQGPSLMTGRGERVRRVGLPWDGWITLLLPKISISTPQVYEAWKPGEDLPPDSLLGKIDHHESVVDAATWMAGAFNMLERPLHRVCPDLGELRLRAEALAERAVRVSGSGSTMFTAFDAETQAEDYARRAREVLNIETRVVRPMTGGQEKVIRGEEVAC